MSESEWNGRAFHIVDTGGIDPSMAGKDPLSIGSAEYIGQIRSQAELAIREADVVLFLVDAISGVTPADKEVAEILRRNQRKVDGIPTPPVLLVVNKADNSTYRADAADFYELGIGEPYTISPRRTAPAPAICLTIWCFFPPKKRGGDIGKNRAGWQPCGEVQPT